MMQTGEHKSNVVRLRSDLQASLHKSGEDIAYVVEDPLNNAFFQLGPAEWDFAQQLDGATTWQQAYQRTANRFAGNLFSQESARRLVDWLMASGLTHDDGARRPRTAHTFSPWHMVSHAFFLRLPLFHPDRWLEKIHPAFAWCFSRWSLLAWVLLCVGGFHAVMADLGRFWHSAAVYLSPSSWIHLFVIWTLLKVVHEMFHGLACKHFGGHVGACGVALILFSPVAYVDVSSAWRFRSKWRRIITSAAGLYIELAVASVAAIVWSQTDSPSTAFLCHATVMAAGVNSILFNANPLMRYDAYYILSDLLDVQNLYGDGRHASRACVRKLLLGLATPASSPDAKRPRFVLFYGLASGLWRVTVSVSLILAAARLLHGAGMVLAIVAVMLWFGIPAVQFARFVVSGNEREQPHRARFAVTLALAAAGLAAVMICPVPGGVHAPVIVEFEPLHELRAASTGFVETVRVAAGQQVRQGQTLVELRNDELASELRMVSTEVQQTAVHLRILRDQDRYAEYQAELSRRKALLEREKSLQALTQGLVVAAPADGVVLTHRPQQLLGKYVKAGEPLVSIAAESDKDIKVSIPEPYIELFLNRVGSSVNIVLNGAAGAVRSAKLVRVDPSATDLLRQPLLGAHNGGPLPVRSDESASDHGGPHARLVAPHFQGVVEVPQRVAQSLHVGQIGELHFTDPSENLGRRLVRFVERWLARRM